MYVHAKVTPNAKRESLARKDPTHFLVSIKEKPERNMANARVCELIAQYFTLPIEKVRIISGHHHPSKILSVDVLE